MKNLFYPRFCLLMVALFALNSHAEEQIQISEPNWVAPSDAVPPEFSLRPSNNNASIALHEGRLYVAWRNAPTHFASKKTKIFVASSPDMGKTWVAEHEICLQTDMREPFLISVKGQLILQFFEGGSNPFTFTPKHMLRTLRRGLGDWTPLEAFGTPGEVPWEVKVRNGQVYMTSYLGDHYSGGKSKIDVHFSVSPDGLNWKPVNPSAPFVYEGGVSEVGFEYTEDGTLWGVTRNEDGDDSGFGSSVYGYPLLYPWRRKDQSIPA